MLTTVNQPLVPKPLTFHQKLSHLMPLLSLQPIDINIDGQPVVIYRRPVMLKLFEAFLNHPNRHMSAVELSRMVYLDCEDMAISKRRQQSLKQNVVKLISRARDHANAAVNLPHCVWIEWFPYYPEEERWGLFRLTTHFVSMREDFMYEEPCLLQM